MLEPALHFAGSSVSWLELWAFALALGGVVLTARVSPWGWPPTIVASALYGWLFFEHRLYGDAALQLFFIAVSAWGWRAWLRTTPADASRVGSGVRSLDARVTRRLALALVACWAVLGALLARFTDTDVPWFDAAPTAGSVFAQVLLARKFVQAWALWIGVNLVAVALFAGKSLWLTALLYLIFVALSVAGWRRWRQLAQRP
mgnify:FL=1